MNVVRRLGIMLNFGADICRKSELNPVGGFAILKYEEISEYGNYEIRFSNLHNA